MSNKENMFKDFIGKSTEDTSKDDLSTTDDEKDSVDNIEPQDNISVEDDHRQSPPNTISTDLSGHNLPESILPWDNSQTNYTQSLLDAGYTTIKLIASATVSEISSITSIPDRYITLLIRKANEWQNYSFETASSLLDDRSELHKISTGSSSLDDLLGGGVEPRSITEFYGAFTTGKTQVCMQLAINTALSTEQGGQDGRVVYIDTEGSFRPERVVQICNNLNYNADVILDKILIGRAHNTNGQMKLTNKLFEMHSKFKDIKLVIIDSLTSNFRAEFIGKGTLMERQQRLNQHIQQLSRVADMLNVAVVITNQVLSVINGFEDAVLPVGGNILAHGSTHRIHFTKSEKHSQVRHAKLVASPSLPEEEANFMITHSGITDIKYIHQQ